MILTKDQIEDIRAVLAATENGITVYEKGKTEDDEGWYITKDDISEYGKKNEAGDFSSWKNIGIDTFLESTQKLNLVALFSPSSASIPSSKEFEDWPHLAKYLGITDMVTLGVKVPAIIARRFKYFATEESDVSTKLRELILEYLRTQWQEKAEQLIYEETI